MKNIFYIVALLAGTYLLLTWAGDNPGVARDITGQVDQTASGIVDKGERAVKELSH
jgi:hypothetical protein